MAPVLHARPLLDAWQYVVAQRQEDVETRTLRRASPLITPVELFTGENEIFSKPYFRW